MPDTNPLLQHWSLPPWSDIRAEHLLPAINVIVAENQQIIADIDRQPDRASKLG